MPYSGSGTPVAATQAPLLFPDAGGYVLCGLISFVLGVVLTLFCLRKRRGDETGNGIKR
jgi:hypothetical protein